MYLFSFISMFYILITIIVMMIPLLLGKKSIKDREKPSPFECGFSPFNKTRFPFSLRFFIITILFIIFEVEIALLLPLSAANNLLVLKFSFLTIMLIMLILLLGLIHEWVQGVIKWSI